MKVTTFTQRDFPQVLQIAHVIHVRKETRLAVIASLYNVLRDIGEP